MAVDYLKEWWTWCEFKKHVASACPLEYARLFGEMVTDQSGATTSKYFLDRLREAVIDLQQFVPAFTKNHESIYYPSDFVDDGEASVGSLPPFGKVRSAWYYSTDKKRRFKVVQLPWEKRFELTTHRDWDTLNSQFTVLTAYSISAMAMAETLTAGHRERVAVMSISPQHEQFYLFPHVTGEWVFSLFWDGNKLDFRDMEQVPFQEQAANAVAQFVQSRFGGYVEHDQQKVVNCMTEYTRQRTLIYLEELAKGDIK